MSEWADFHRPAFRDWRWLETCWFSFFVPTHGIRCHLRAAFRTNQGVAHGMAIVYSRGGSLLDMDFFDSQMHLPIGEHRYSEFALPNGLSVKGRPSPNTYQVRFLSRCKRLEIDVTCEAMMAPTDLAFTTIGAGSEGFAAFHGPAKGDAPTGHIDQTFRVRGTMMLDGEIFPVDCVSNHDRSWSPRAEFKSQCGVFDNFHYGEALTVLTQSIERPFNHPKITHGYILRENDLRGIRSAEVEYRRDGFITKALTYRITDSKGETYKLDLECPYAIEQDQGGNGYTVMHYCRGHWDGHDGYGESMWHWDIPEMQRRVRAARKRDPDASIDSIFAALGKEA